jgi:glycosyltransferase involved in cell wall biosynthesis
VKIGVNAWRLRGRRTGVGRYLHNVLAHWTEDVLAARAERVTVYSPAPLAEELGLPVGLRQRVVGPHWPMLVWESLRMAPVADDDVLLCPSYTRPLATGARTVVTTHDATLHMYPELYPPRARIVYDRLYGWSARRATLVITTSETVRGDVARCYDVPTERIRVVRLGTDEHIRPLPGDPRVDEVRERYIGSPDPFFLFVGKLTARRNVPMLLEAFADLRSRQRRHRLLIVGLDTHGLDVAGMAARLGLDDAVVHREYVAEEDLVALYNAAEVLVMPSTFETLSLPVMEAQAVGTPVITIDTPGMRETTGGAAWLLPRAETPELVEAMGRLASDAGLRDELAGAGLAEAAKRSWDRCSIETLAVLQEAATLERPEGALNAAEARS